MTDFLPPFVTHLYTIFLFETHTLIERSLLQILIILELLIAFYIIMRTLRSVRFLLSNKAAVGNTYSFESSPKVTTAHFVLFGDSTAFGTGSGDQHNSVAGRLAKDYPHAHIDNKAENGALIQDVAQKIYEGGDQFYDLALILIGGNDVVFLTSRKSIRHNLGIILKRAKEMTNNKVILVSPMNVGASLMFWFPNQPPRCKHTRYECRHQRNSVDRCKHRGILSINIFYGWRSRVLRKIFHSVSKAYDVRLVDLYIPRSVDFFAEYPKLYFSPDNIHFNGEGYGYIYEEIKEAIQKNKMVRVN